MHAGAATWCGDRHVAGWEVGTRFRRDVELRTTRRKVSRADRGWIEQIGWRSVDDVLSWSAGDVAAVSHTSDVVEVPIDPAFGGPAKVFVKRYRYDSLEHRVKQSFRGTLFGKSRARREFEFLTEMRRRAIPTVRPIAYGDNYGRVFLRASFLITEGVEGFQSLDLFALQALRDRSLDRGQWRRLTAELATMIRRMHDAGIHHGGLFLRNILVRAGMGGGYDFVLIDPDTHGRMTCSRVAESYVVSDLSEVVASGMALGRRYGLATLMKSYFQTPRLSLEQKKVTSQIVARAWRLAPGERRRMAITEAIGWLRERADAVSKGKASERVFRSVDEFFDTLCSCATGENSNHGSERTIRFSFADANGSGEPSDRTVVFEGDGVSVSSARPSQADLTIFTDTRTWLAVVCGRAEAGARLRSGNLRIEGDSTLLHTLMRRLDQVESKCVSRRVQDRANRGAESGRRLERPEVQCGVTSSVRPFGRKYKADDYAHYYSQKHAATLARRISNYFERRMIRRSLLRIRRKHYFESVLDCPSGTGRFLPTLASLGVSVVAMDTSDAMLREGRKYHGLFTKFPMAVACSAFEIALPDNAVDVILCSRLLHHVSDREDRLRILREFARVAKVGVVISFFDADCFRSWKRARKECRSGKPRGRFAMSRSVFLEETAQVGLRPIGMNALLRFHTEVTAAAFLC